MTAPEPLVSSVPRPCVASKTCVLGIEIRPLVVWGQPDGWRKQVGWEEEVVGKNTMVIFLIPTSNSALGEEGSQYLKPAEASYTHTHRHLTNTDSTPATLNMVQNQSSFSQLTLLSETCMIIVAFQPKYVIFLENALLQLDCRSVRRTQKINIPTNQKGCDNSETTVGKLSARRIQICWVYISVINF